MKSTRFCNKCGQTKDIIEFQFDKRKVNMPNKGFVSPCKKCKYSQKSKVRKERRVIKELQQFSYSQIPVKRKSTIFKRKMIIANFNGIKLLDEANNFFSMLYAEKRNIKFKTYALNKENEMLIFCNKCFDNYKLKLPIPLSDLIKISDNFNKIHSSC